MKIRANELASAIADIDKRIGLAGHLKSAGKDRIFE